MRINSESIEVRSYGRQFSQRWILYLKRYWVKDERNGKSTARDVRVFLLERNYDERTFEARTNQVHQAITVPILLAANLM